MFLVDGDPKDCKFSKTAFKSNENAQIHAAKWIKQFEPDVVITEKITKTCRKGDHAKQLIAAVTKVAEEHRDISDIQVARVQSYKNKYEEARALAERFPQLKPRLPKEPHCWQSEPFSTTYFEALSMALLVIDQRGAL